MASAHNLKALNLQAWIDEHRELLKPPVGNKLIWDDGEQCGTMWNDVERCGTM